MTLRIRFQSLMTDQTEMNAEVKAIEDVVDVRGCTEKDEIAFFGE